GLSRPVRPSSATYPAAAATSRSYAPTPSSSWLTRAACACASGGPLSGVASTSARSTLAARSASSRNDRSATVASSTADSAGPPRRPVSPDSVTEATSSRCQASATMEPRSRYRVRRRSNSSSAARPAGMRDSTPYSGLAGRAGSGGGCAASALASSQRQPASAALPPAAAAQNASGNPSPAYGTSTS